MRKEILTERTLLFAPNITVTVKVEIDGNPTDEQITKAIQKAVSMNEILNSRIVLEADGRAFYERTDSSNYSVEICNEEWITLVKRNAIRPYNIFDGELCRFFILRHDHVLELLVIGHHFAGDGLSFIFFIEDIMNALAGNELKYKPLEVVDVNKLDPDSKLQWVKRSYLSYLNRQWKAKKVVYNTSDYEKMMQEYALKYSNEIFSDAFNAEETKGLISASKEIGVSVNSFLTTTFIKEQKVMTDIGLSASIRNKNYKGMANLVSGLSFLYQYDTAKDFEENARAVHKLIHDKFNNKQKKYFVLRVIDLLDGSFIDSACMVKYLGYKNKLSEKLAKLMYYADNSKDIGVSNLTKPDIQTNYGGYAIKNLAFLPPTVPYADRVFGIITLGDTMSITMNTTHADKKKEQNLFENVIKAIKIQAIPYQSHTGN